MAYLDDALAAYERAIAKQFWGGPLLPLRDLTGDERRAAEERQKKWRSDDRDRVRGQLREAGICPDSLTDEKLDKLASVLENWASETYGDY